MPAPTIETPRLLLRPWRDEDVDAWATMNADPRVAEFFMSPESREQSETSAARLREALDRNGYGWWIAEVKADSHVAGVMILQDVPFEAPFTPAGEIGWRLRSEDWGNGYATEGANALLAHAFNALHWPEVVAMTSTLNVPSQRVMQRIGMTHDPADDFDHPRIPAGHRLHRHVLYRIKAPAQ